MNVVLYVHIWPSGGHEHRAINVCLMNSIYAHVILYSGTGPIMDTVHITTDTIGRYKFRSTEHNTTQHHTTSHRTVPSVTRN